MEKSSAIRRYMTSESVLFSKTKEAFGGLSNMAAGYSLFVNELVIPTSEHLYQALRFPDHPQIQWEIINERSPMKAKWIGRSHIDRTRQDWDQIQFKVMQWVLEVKLAQNWDSFSELLRSTGERNIVEITPKPKVWGAVNYGDYLEGVNALGRLLMFLREKYVYTNSRLNCVNPLEINNFSLLGYKIGVLCDDLQSKTTFETQSLREFVFA